MLRGQGNMCQIGDPIAIIEVPKSKPLTGWREWSFHGGRLAGRFRNQYTWKRLGENKAKGRIRLRGEHGLWAFFKARSVVGYKHGNIEAWGQVVIHQHGFRAEYARITRLRSS